MKTNMTKKQYIVPLTEEVVVNYPLMSALNASDVPGDAQSSAPARRPGHGSSEAPVF